MIDTEIMRKCNSPYALPMVVVKRKMGLMVLVSITGSLTDYDHRSAADDESGRFILQTWTMLIFLENRFEQGLLTITS